MRLLVSMFMLVFISTSFLGAVGLARGDSYAALAAIRVPLRITWTVDSVTTRMVGGGHAFGEDVGATVYKRLKAAGVPMRDGSFDPLKEPFVSLDLWARGVTRGQDTSDKQRSFNFQLQVFAPASLLKGPPQKGRVTVWERSLYGACAAGDIQSQVRSFLRLCGDFSADWRAAHAAQSGMHKTSPNGAANAPAVP